MLGGGAGGPWVSGPKVVRYEVVGNSELRRRALEAARAAAAETARRVDAFTERLDAARALCGDDVSTLGAGVPRADLTSGDRDAVEHWSANASAWLRQAEQDLAALVARRELQGMVDVLAAEAAVGAPSSAIRLYRPAETDEAVPEEAWRARIAGRIRETLQAIDSGVDESDRAGIEALAVAALAARAEAGAAPLCVELRLRVHQVSEAATARRRQAEEAATLLASLHGLAESDDEPVVQALMAVERGTAQMSDELRVSVAEFAVSARREADRRYTASVVAAALSDMGYEVEEGFATLVGTGGGQAARWAAHAVRVQLDSAGELAVRVVRQEGEQTSDDQLREDREVEHEFCRDFAALATRMEAQAVRVRIISHVMPGEKPVETVDRLRARRRENHNVRAAHMRASDRRQP